MYSEAIEKPAKSAIGPTYSLLEVLMHELSNPVQVARTNLNLLEVEGKGTDQVRARVTSLNAAYERIASVVQCVQSIKDCAQAAVPVPAARLISELRAEFAALDLSCDIIVPQRELPLLLVHEGAVPLLIGRWAAQQLEKNGRIRVSFQQVDRELEVTVSLRTGQPQAVSREMGTSSVAGYPAALGEFMRAANGRAFLYEDDLGAFELVLYFST
ncbi:MAG: hypothetical protein IPG71_06860 [bacterium]|nr:hypothetical protein [bacterium]